MATYVYDHDFGAIRWRDDAEYRGKMQDYYLEVTGYPPEHLLAVGEYEETPGGRNILYYTLMLRKSHPDMLEGVAKNGFAISSGIDLYTMDVPVPPWVTWGCYITPTDNEPDTE